MSAPQPGSGLAGDGWIPPLRGADAARRWGAILVAFGVVASLALLPGRSVGLPLGLTGAAVVVGAALLLVSEVVGSRAARVPATLWHPDDFVVEVDRASGLVRSARGAVPGTRDAARVVSRPIDELLLAPRVRADSSLLRRRRRRPSPPFLADWRAPDGTTRRTETVVQAAGPRLVLYGRDVTAEQEERDRLARRAATDPLTGLPNRRLLDDALGRAAARSRRTGAPWAVALVDLDGFKALNDAQGHAEGDRALVAIAAALRDAARASDEVLRLGGDELVLVASDLAREDTGALVGERLLAAVRRLDLAGVTASVGVAVGVGPGDAPHLLVDRADAAMYEAKRAGGDQVRVVAVLPAC